MIGNFGVLSTGVTIKRQTDIIGQMQSALQTALNNPAFTLLPNSPEGQLLLRSAEQAADLWELGEQVAANYYPASASGASLDAAFSLVNIPRLPAAASVANSVVVSGISGTVLPANYQLYVTGNPAYIFQLYPFNTPQTIGAGGSVTCTFTCTQTGAIAAPAGTLINQVSPVGGVSGIVQATAAQTGAPAETDPAYRQRAIGLLGAFGSGTYAGILKAVFAVPNVSQAFLAVNDLDVTVGGLLPHSIQLTVVGGADQDIYNSIFAAGGNGVSTNGSQTGTVVDSQGISHAVSFSREVQVPIYVDVTIVPNTNPANGPTFPGNGLSAIQSAIIAFGASYVPGQTVVTTALFTPVNLTPGVNSAVINIGTAYPATSSDNITMTSAQVAQFLAGTDGSSNIYVNVHE